jgi:Ser/Thr protein kinase RdoA (MazF antagonist)
VSNRCVNPLDLAAREVLHRFVSTNAACGLAHGIHPVALGNRGGFSGARLWRVEGTAGVYCLRAWPPGDPAPERLHWIHQLMQRARSSGLDFVPSIARTDQDTTWVAHAGRLWDLSTWMPGKADFHNQPSSVRLEAACTALARLHAAWSDDAPQLGPCPGIGRRLAIAHHWVGLLKSGWHLPLAVAADDPVRPWAERAWSLLHTWLDFVPRALATWAERSFPLQPCLCDIWHDHVLFEGNVITGLIDYGSVKVDHVAVDLARLLGSMIEDNAELRRTGLQSYARLRPLSWEEQALVSILDKTGTIIALANWLKWLYRDEKLFEDRMAVARRIANAVQRIEKWQEVDSIQ